MKREPVEFRVPLEVTDGKKKATKWLDAEGNFTEDEGAAAVFVLYDRSTVLERIKMDEAMHEYAGGLAAFLSLSDGIDNAERAIIAIVEARLWPDGRPDPETITEKARRANAEAVEAGFDKYEGEAKEGWRVMTGMRDRLAFLAAWRVLFVSGPDGWEDLADNTLSEIALYRLWDAYLGAKAEHDLGNARSSKPPSATD